MKIIYEPVKFKADYEKIMESIASLGKCFVAYTAQYSHLFSKMKDSGLVLGCNVNAAKGFSGKTIAFVGDGVFHALMIKKANLKKKVVIVNPIDYSKKEVTLDDVKKFIAREAVSLQRLKDAKTIGIIVSTKQGQERVKEAEALKKRLESKGKKVYLFISETVNPDEFMNFPKIELIINTACSRIGLDDYSKFGGIPVVNLELALSYQ